MHRAVISSHRGVVVMRPRLFNIPRGTYNFLKSGWNEIERRGAELAWGMLLVDWPAVFTIFEGKAGCVHGKGGGLTGPMRVPPPPVAPRARAPGSMPHARASMYHETKAVRTERADRPSSAATYESTRLGAAGTSRVVCQVAVKGLVSVFFWRFLSCNSIGATNFHPSLRAATFIPVRMKPPHADMPMVGCVRPGKTWYSRVHVFES